MGTTSIQPWSLGKQFFQQNTKTLVVQLAGSMDKTHLPVLQLELAILFFKFNPETRDQNGEANGSVPPGTLLFITAILAGTSFDSDIPHVGKISGKMWRFTIHVCLKPE